MSGTSLSEGNSSMEGSFEAAGASSPSFRELGNAAFQSGRYLQAIELYTSAIEVGPPTAALFSNRAAAHLKCESYGSALSDADMAVRLDPKFVKGYYRRGSTLLAMGKVIEAKDDFLKLKKFDPKNKDVVAQLKECDNMIKEKLEEAYRRTEEEAGVGGGGMAPSSLTANFSPESVPVPGDYKGPILPRIPERGMAASAETCASNPDAVNVHGISLSFVRELKADFKSQRLLAKRFAWEILIRLRNVLLDYLSLIRVDFPADAKNFNVCGDTHGQYYDTCNIFENVAGEPSPTNPYLFNGDFCDRGSWGVENVLLLCAWKLLYPDSVHLLRGNHETKLQNKVYGFEGEVRHKYCLRTMELFTAMFQALPLAAVISGQGEEGRVMVTHGGLFCSDGVKLKDIENIGRFQEPGEEGGLMSDLLWSDPQPFPGRSPSKRGVGQSFGPDITRAFLDSNDLLILIRSHEVKDDGYVVEHGGRCITVFSAPNYCDTINNKGAVCILSHGSMDAPTFKQFTCVPHPPIRPMAYSMGYASLFGM